MNIDNLDTYEDIINLDHPEPKTQLRMSMENRAAQFTPFAALTGFEDVIEQAALQIREDFREYEKFENSEFDI